MMHPIRFFYRAHHGSLPPEGDRTCWLCGSKTSHSARAVDVVRSTFPEAARERFGGVDDVCCEACDWYYDFKIFREGAKRAMGFFTKSVLVRSDGWVEWLRPTMLTELLEWHAGGLPDDMILGLNFSKQGHAIPNGRVLPRGSRELILSTDDGLIALPREWPELTGAVAWLWSRGHVKTLISEARATPMALRRSDDPAADLGLLAFLRPWANSLVMNALTYVVTEEERDAHSRFASGVLQRIRRVPAEGSFAVGDRECGRELVVQESVQEALVADAGGKSTSGGTHGIKPGRVEQSGLFEA
jgi:hypothetical protein